MIWFCNLFLKKFEGFCAVLPWLVIELKPRPGHLVAAPDLDIAGPVNYGSTGIS